MSGRRRARLSVPANIFLHYVLDLWFHKASEGSGRSSDHCPGRYRGRVSAQAGCGAIPSRCSGKAALVSPGQDSSCRVRPVRHGELPEARVRLPGFQALLHEDPDRTVQARSQNGSQGPASRRGFANDGTTTYGRSASGESVKAGSTTSPSLAVHVPSEAETPVDAGDTPPLPTPPLQLEAIGAHDRTSLAVHPSPMAGPAVCRQAPEAGWTRLWTQIIGLRFCGARIGWQPVARRRGSSLS